ncbi:MAG: serine protease [Spirochaetes bacterium]|nr:MAG: serine protease [Spirochaetota bacterium]
MKRLGSLISIPCALIIALAAYQAPAAVTDAKIETPVHEPGMQFLSKSVLSVIEESVFEVVTSKPVKDSLSYEKPLPLDLIPFAIRNDKYYSIGTAFAISPTEFLSASHLFDIGIESQFRDYYIRDRKGNVFEIDEIFKFSDEQDFIIFTAKGKSVKNTLPARESYTLNEQVYAVGNALGQGVIVRDGVLTSTTPEEEKGRWEWLRFSAAASPGNSGGPLLDREGKVIGVITRKSENENLNYALPVSKALGAARGLAVSHKRVKYSLVNTRKKKFVEYDYQAKLPKKFSEFNAEMTRSLKGFIGATHVSFLSENRESFFPRGKGSQNLLYSNYTPGFPSVIAEDEDGEWTPFKPKSVSRSNLDANGFFQYGELGGFIFIYFQKPDDMPLSDVYANPRRYMDLVLKGSTYNRSVMNEKIRITSLGDPVENFTHVDGYKRVWMVHVWQLEYNDSRVLTFTLLVPGGAVVIMKSGQTGVVNEFVTDLKTLADFVIYPYYGTFRQWEEFLKCGPYLPGAFSGIQFSYKPGAKALLKTARFSMEYTPELFPIADQSDMSLKFAFYPDKNAVVWDICGVTMGENKGNNNHVAMFRELKPDPALKESFQIRWGKIAAREHPFNGVSYTYEGSTYIHAPCPGYGKGTPSGNYLYTVRVGMEGNVEAAKIEKKLNGAMAVITLYE